MPESTDVGELHGMINVLKPPGMTSHDVVQYLRRLLKQRRIGHAGTLDPGAAGVLVVAVGRATRLAEFATSSTKTYRAEMMLGVTTDTLDAFGQVTGQGDYLGVSVMDFETALQKFRGRIMQIPPMVSAVRHHGRRLYELAREGLEVPREARPVEILDLRLLRWEPPAALIDVTCTSGTYIRTLCADAGQLLGCGAHLSFLVRTRSGGFGLAEAFSLEQIRDAVSGDETAFLQPMETAVSQYPAVSVRSASMHRVFHGRELTPADLEVPCNEDPRGQWVRVYGPDGQLAAMGQVERAQEVSLVQLKKVLIT